MGAGSTVFAKNVLGDTLVCDALRECEIALYDIDKNRLSESEVVIRAINKKYNADRAVIKTYLGVENRKAALRGAKFVINAIQVGLYDPCTIIDFEIPKKYGLRQTIADTLGIERYQSVPLYLLTDTLVPERYGEDGSLVRFLADGENFVKVSPIYIGEEWYVPKRYVKVLPDTTHFIKTIMIDRRDQNIMTLEQTGEAQWTVRSMNPATTGRHRPPNAQETPLGIFVLQEKKTRMIFLKDGSTATGGFAPYASRFSDGGYIHGVPVNEPRKALIEYSPSLGTTPRSHMCVRNATSHSKFIFDWAPVNETIIFVLE